MTDNKKLGFAFRFNSGKLLTLVRGCPGSGKSTLAKSMAGRLGGPIHLEADMYFSRDGTYKFDPELLTRAHRWCLNTTEVLLQNVGLVVVSNTFTRYIEMFDYLEFAYKHKIDCNVITMENDFGSVHDVPEETLKKMRERFFPHETVMERLRADFPQ